MPRLENWSMTVRFQDPYQAPEQGVCCLQGNIFDDEHERFPDGTFVTTSLIKGSEGEKIITNSGTKYELGEIDPEYEKQYPDAKKRIFEQINP